MKSIKYIFPGFLLSAIAVLSIISCDDNAIEGLEQDAPSKYNVKAVNVSVDDFVSADAVGTRTDYYTAKDGYKFGWSTNDTIGIKAINLQSADETTPQIYMSVNSTNSDQRNQVRFSGEYFNLRSDVDYVAYYPYNDSFTKVSSADSHATITYKGQFQKANRGISHISSYDYLVAKAPNQHADEDGNLNFNFKHVGGLVTFELDLKGYTGARFKQMNLYHTNALGSQLICTGGELSLNPNEDMLVNRTNSSCFTVDFNNIVPDAVGKLQINVMMAPRDYTLLMGKFKIELIGTDGYLYTPTQPVPAVNITSGSYNKITNTTPFARTLVSETTMINGRDFNIAIRRNLDLNTDHMDIVPDLDLVPELYVHKVRFEREAPDNNYDIDLTAPKSLVDVKARFDTDEQTLYIRTIAENLKIQDASYMFYNFANLTSIEGLQLLDTSSATSMASMFAQCPKIEQLDLSGFNTSSATSMASMFAQCPKIEQLDLTSFDTSSVTDMSSMFSDCKSLRSILINKSNFKTSNVTTMNSMFNLCMELRTFNDGGDTATAFDVSGFNTAKVTDMGHMFDHCLYIFHLDISSFDVSKVENMSCMFRYCMFIKDIKFPSVFDTSNVEDMSSMFSNCTCLEYIRWNENTKTPKVKNFSGMFFQCEGIKSITLRGVTFDSCISAASMFRYLLNAETINIPKVDYINKSGDEVIVDNMFTLVNGETRNTYVYAKQSFIDYINSDTFRSGVDTSAIEFMAVAVD